MTVDLAQYDLRNAVGSDEEIRATLAKIDRDLNGAGPSERSAVVEDLRSIFDVLSVEVEPSDVISIQGRDGRESRLSDVDDVLDEHLPGFDKQAVHAALSVVLADKEFGAGGDSVWLILIAAPSSGKTFVLTPLGLCRWGTRILSNVTPKTFLSGFQGPGGSDPSLLTRIDPDGDAEPLFVIKELGQLLAGPADVKDDVFAQLREIYDGRIMKEFGTGVTRSWEGNATIIAGMTQALDENDMWDAQLGERFLKIRLRGVDKDPKEQALDAINAVGTEESAKEALIDAYEAALDSGAAFLNKGGVSIRRPTKVKIAHLGPFLGRLRTSIAGDAAPVWEKPFRSTKLLYSVACAYTALRGEETLSDFSLLYRLTMDGMPEPRRSILLLCMAAQHENGEIILTRDNIKAAVNSNYVYQRMKDLVSIGVLDVEKGAGRSGPGGGKPPDVYRFSKTSMERLEESGLWSWITTDRRWKEFLPDSVQERIGNASE